MFVCVLPVDAVIWQLNAVLTGQ